MKKFIIHNSSFLICLLCISLCCTAQPSNYRFRFIDLPENFRSQFISWVDEDASGMLWFVTKNGLHRYDGNQVLNFDMQSKPALPDISITYLFADSRQRLWIATGKKLWIFDLKKWQINQVHFPANGQETITAIVEGNTNEVLLGSAAGKLFTYADEQPLLLFQTPAIKGITTIQQNNPGDTWFTTTDGQLVHLSKDHQLQASYDTIPAFQKTGIEFLSVGNNGKCFVYADDAGAFIFDTHSKIATKLTTTVQLPFSSGSNFPVAVAQDKVAMFFSASGQSSGNFYLYDLSNNSFTSQDASYPPSFKTSIFRKANFRHNRIYISTDRGIGLVNYMDNPFHILLTDLDNVNSIRTIYKTAANKLYVGSYKDHFGLLDEKTNEQKHLSDLMISCLKPWSEDSLLAGTEGQYLMWYSIGSGKLTPVLKRHADTAAVDKYALCLLKENDTLVWVGTYSGCYLFNPVSGTVVPHPLTAPGNLLQHKNVTDILKLGSKRFFATYEGIYRYDMPSGKMEHLFAANDSSYARLPYNCLSLSGDEVWAGSSGGGITVFDSDGKIKKRLTVADGLASNVVFSLPVSNGYVLAGTSKGLSIIDPKTGSIRNYSSQYFLPSNEFNRSAWFVRHDTVYMGTINGIVRFTVKQLLAASTPTSAPLKLTAVSLNDGTQTRMDYSVAHSDQQGIVIPAGTKSFSISFGELDDASGELDLFYRFAGDQNWQHIGQRGEITFVNLTPGTYNLEVGARLPDGQWAGQLLTLPIEMKPRFYQTVWFKILLGLASLALIWIGVKYRERQLRKEQQLRSRIAGDLHDQVGSALTRIYFQAERLAINKADKDTEQLSNLEKIAGSSREAMSSMSDMVWSIDAHYDNSSDMVDRMKDYLARLQDEFDCDLHFEISGDRSKRHLTKIDRQNFFLIFKEAVNNALKYGLDKQATINLHFEKHQLILTVQNEIASTLNKQFIANGGHGLKSMQLRADKINAKLSIIHTEKLFTIQLGLRI